MGRLPGLAARNIVGLVSVGRFRHGGGTHPPTLFSGPRSSINVSLSDRRTFAVTDLPMGAVREICGAVGLVLRTDDVSVPGEVLKLCQERDAARGAKDWARADAIRDQLQADGWVVEDKAGGTTVHKK